ncbi:MAG: mechanosensitive ion channel family protein [Campylobacteraceae bacterium]
MREHLIALLGRLEVETTDFFVTACIIGIIVLTALIIYFITRVIVYNTLKSINEKKPNFIISSLLQNNLFFRLSWWLQAWIVYFQVSIWINKTNGTYEFLHSLSALFIIFFMLLSVYSVIDTIFKTLYEKTKTPFFAMQSVIQTIKLILGLIALIYTISVLIDKSPVAILGSLGAMSAVLMLVFKDTILGFVAGLQLSTNNMVHVGDWIEMPKYGADGDVINIGLTTVKVRNWDKTITTIPTYSLVSDSFKNWQGMRESGGRRIKRSMLIDVHSIKFLSDDDYQRLLKANLIHEYLEDKKEEIEEFNAKLQPELANALNERRLTNIGTFRAYVFNYLRNSPRIKQDMTLMVRQLEPTNFGIPLQVYCFTNTVLWTEYENIQSDIFDHIYSVIEDFGLKAYQTE